MQPTIVPKIIAGVVILVLLFMLAPFAVIPAGYRGVLVAASLAATATAAREASARHELDAAFADLMGAA